MGDSKRAEQAREKGRNTDFGTGDDRERAHHPVGVLLPDFGDEEGTHTSTGSTSKRVGDLETCTEKKSFKS